MTTPTTHFLLATSTGIALSSIFFGANSALTYITLPTLLHPSPSPTPSSSKTSTSTSSPPSKPTSSLQPLTPSSHLATQWSHIFYLGSRAGPGIALPSALCFIYASRLTPYPLPNPSNPLISPRNLLLAAAVFNILIIPFTFIAMKGTNNELHRRAALAATNPTSDGNDEAVSKKGDHEQETTTGVERFSTPALITHWGKLNMRRASLHLIAIGLGISALVLY